MKLDEAPWSGVHSCTLGTLPFIGRLDILVSNAAMRSRFAPFEQMAWEEFAQRVNDELKAAFEQKARFQERFKGQLSQKMGIRSFFKLLTAIWGVGLLLEFALHAVLVYTFTTSQMLVIGPIISYGFLGGLGLLTMLLFKWLRRTQQKTLEETPTMVS